ncbi:MAG: cell division protein FtsQ/DivIB [Stenotrophobium sp.]
MAAERIDVSSIKLRPLLTGLSSLLLLLGIAALWPVVRGIGAVSRLQVVGDFNHVGPLAVRAAIEDQLKTGFLGLDLDALRRSVESLPWVEQARVERVWPADVRVRVWERKPYARWDDKQLLSTRAVPFTPKPADIPAGLPQLSGQPGHEAEVMQAYEHLSAALAATPFALASLSQDARGEWTAQTKGGIELHLGRDAPESKLSVITGPMSRALASRLQEIKYVDLRYTNGFAVAWLEPTPAKGGKKQ